MHRSFLASVCLTFALSAAPAHAESAALERIGAIAARTNATYCPTDEMRAFDGAISGVNAAHGAEAPITVRTRSAAGFADALDAALANSEMEQAAINAMIQAFDDSNTLIPASAAQQPRDDAPRPTVSWRVANGVAIIVIPNFSETSGDAVYNALRESQSASPTGYIVDLRDNQGGLLDHVVAIADHFIDGGPVLVTRPFGQCAGEEAETYNARAGDITDGAPVIVLVNAATASGAELLAATLRERRNATLVGQTTHGDAKLHTIIPVNGGRDGFLKLRTATLTTPAGATWDQTGLTPDVTTEPGDATLAHAIAALAAR